MLNTMDNKKEKILSQLKHVIEFENSDHKKISKLSAELSKLDENYQRFYIDAKTLIHLGRESIKDHTTALVELVKNSYDADSNNVDIEIYNDADGLIRVSDNGFGMTKEQLLNNWLRIGFSSKRHSKVSDLGRRKTGEKGIGRISADRLGAKLELISKTVIDGIVGLRINWDDFDIDGKDLSEIDVEVIYPDAINTPHKKNIESETGTEIKITNLRQKWTSDNLENLFNELATLTSPFNKVEDFSITLQSDLKSDFTNEVKSKYFEAAEIDLTVIYDGTDEVYYSIKDKLNEKELIKTINIKQFYAKKDLFCGPLEIRLLFFLREGASVIGTDFKLKDLRTFLDNNYGVKIYRDNVAVKPYGFPKAQLGFDWLKIGEEKAKNPAGIGRGSDYTVSPNQLVGAIFISRDNNSLLKDSAAREGLVENEQFEDMKEFVLASKRLLETHRAQIYSSESKNTKEKPSKNPVREAEKIKNRLTTIKKDLSVLKSTIEDNSKTYESKDFVAPIARTINEIEVVSEDVEKTFSDLLNWQRVLNGLATIGISSAVFGHETEGSITQFQGSTLTSIKLLKLANPSVDKALIELEKARKASKKVAAWGSYALTRVQKEKRKARNISILDTIDKVVEELRPAFTASSIEIIVKGEQIYSKTYQMDIETILVNLLTNAYTATTLTSAERKIIVSVKREDNHTSGYFFSVADSGPSIAKEFEKRIFEPLYSTKSKSSNKSNSVGTGLGLTIIRSIVEELNGKLSFTTDIELKGANFKIWLPKIN
jgi:signal transduction histidine kinase